jgi:hypothetical protein
MVQEATPVVPLTGLAVQPEMAVPPSRNLMLPPNGTTAVPAAGATVAESVICWSTVGELGDAELTVTAVSAAFTVKLVPLEVELAV